MSTIAVDPKVERRLERYAEAVRMTDEGTARPKVAEAVGHIRAGLNGCEIAEVMDLSRSQVYQLLGDPTDEQNRARKAAYNGTCNECGAETSYGNGDGPPELCIDCSRTRNADRNAEIERRWRAGETAVQIGEALGISATAVGSWVNNERLERGADLPLHRRRNREVWDELERLWMDGVSVTEIGQRLNMPYASVCEMARQMRAKGRPLPKRKPPSSPSIASPEEIERLWKLGLTHAEMAKRLGYKPSAMVTRVVRLRAKGHDLPLRKGGRRPA